MLNTTAVVPSKYKAITYPCLMLNERRDAVVIATSKSAGTVIHSTCINMLGKHWGEESQPWVDNGWVPIAEATITFKSS